MQSLFIVNTSGDVIIEKHYQGFQTRAVCEIFWREITKAPSRADLSPIIVTPKHYLFHIYAKELYFLTTVQQDTPPLLVIEFLYRVVDVFVDYFDVVSEKTIKENFVTVYQILEEMMDNGFPFTTEPNVLKEMIAPPSIMKSLTSTVTGTSNNVSGTLPDGRLSATYWRGAAKYTKDEIFFDIIEEIDCIIDANGLIVTSEVAGTIMSLCRLSDVPDLTMVFNYPRVMTDVSFHPCVRLARWDQNRVVSFIPPDGNYKLMQYRINSQVNSQVQPPIYCKPTITFSNGQGKVTVMVGPKATGGKPVDDVKITMPFPKSVLTVSLSPTFGKFSYDESTKTGTWNIGQLPKDSPMLTGTVNLSPGVKTPEVAMTVLVEFQILMFACSGLKVESLAVHNVGYKPFKGVRSLTKAGRFQVRTGK
uniref:MHD domain-containing protein n=1 Tax=Paramoeba aestuarina TaxID=180227 RepID=A0A7S4JY63_9EUKA